MRDRFITLKDGSATEDNLCIPLQKNKVIWLSYKNYIKYTLAVFISKT